MRDVYHEGEIAVQQRTGERAIAERRAAMVGERLVEGARVFLAEQELVAVSAIGPDHALVASVWCGDRGFLRSDESGERVAVISKLDRTLDVDPVRPLLREDVPFGMLAMDLESRRRLRINGRVERLDLAGLSVRVGEVFGNCPKYIQRRSRSDVDADGTASPPVVSGHAVDAARRAFIERTDTAFVGSIHERRGLDISHRGGRPGFIVVEGDRVLRIPDYAGNAMYLTLGNFEVDPRAAVALVDFERRRVLSISGSAVATFGVEGLRSATGGTGRHWSLTVERWVEFSLPPSMAWTLIEPSPLNPPLGDLRTLPGNPD
jgi:hypothetical protein